MTVSGPTINLETLTLEQAKALCYDEMVLAARAQQNIRVLEQRIEQLKRIEIEKLIKTEEPEGKEV